MKHVSSSLKFVQWFAVAGTLSLAALGGCQNKESADSANAPDAAPPPVDSTAGKPAEDPVARGKYLVTVLACNDCHTPFKMGEKGEPEPDMSKMLSGHPENLKMPPPPALAPDAPWNWGGAATNTAFFGPWGVSYAINLTPDEVSGLGKWTEEMFVKTMRSGQHFGAARPIMPPMPAQAYKELGEDDLKAIFAFLKTIPPIKNQAPPYEPPKGAPTGG